MGPDHDSELLYCAHIWPFSEWKIGGVRPILSRDEEENLLPEPTTEEMVQDCLSATKRSGPNNGLKRQSSIGRQ